MRNVSLMLMLGTILYPWKLEATCVTPPGCEELGFTADASKCSGSFLRCPWDLNKAACKQQAPLPIVYGDGTVTKEIISGKPPIGIVFDETNRLAVALTNVKKNGSPGSERGDERMNWSYGGYDIPSLTNCTNSNLMTSCNVDGRANTDKILACGSLCKETPAATAANSYEPTGCSQDFCKKNQWFLPSLRDLANIYKIKDLVETSLTLLKSSGTASLVLRYYWSSIEYSTNGAWGMDMEDGSPYMTGKGGSNSVRPVVKY